MKEYPMTFEEFNKRFSTEEQCREYLFKLRFPNEFECPKCGHGEYWKVGETLYTCKSCRHQTSVIAGTIFQDTRKPLTNLVHCNLVGYNSKKWCECYRIAKCFGVEKQSDSLGMAAQNS
jgi:ribosomal protein L37AE/L43A